MSCTTVLSYSSILTQGRPGTVGAKADITPAKGWRGHVGRGWAGACLGGTHMLAP